MNGARYSVIEVGCLECGFGDSSPEVILQTDAREAAVASAADVGTSHEVDRFVFDSEEGSIIHRG